MLVYINSKTDREPENSNSDFSVFFNNPIEIRKQSTLSLRDIQMTNTNLQFKESNSILWIATSNPDVAPEEEVATPLEIDYNKLYEDLDEVVTELNLRATEHSLPITFSLVDNKISLKNTNSSGTTFRVVGTDQYETRFKGIILPDRNVGGLLYNKANKKLGFTNDTRTQQLPYNVSYQAPSIAILSPSLCYYVTCNLTDFENIIGNPYKNPNILSKIQVTSGYGSILTQYYDNPQEFIIVDNTIEKISISILDDEYEPVDLHGGYLTATLEFN